MASDKKRQRQRQEKKPFKTPKLTHYGSIRAITQTGGTIGNADARIRRTFTTEPA